MAISLSVDRRVLFVCLGNICRSPTAEAVFRKLVNESPFERMIAIDSAGISGSHTGAKPDPRAIAVGEKRGYELNGLRARQVVEADFGRFDHIIAMDNPNVQSLKSMCPPEHFDKIGLLMTFGAERGDRESDEVPDPYYGSVRDFEHALALIERGCRGLLKHIADAQSARPEPS